MLRRLFRASYKLPFFRLAVRKTNSSPLGSVTMLASAPVKSELDQVKEKILTIEAKLKFAEKNDSITQYVVPFRFPEINEKERFPLNGIGTVLLNRTGFINRIADLILETTSSSYYFRAPRGSGKSVFLQLLGKELERRGQIVYLIKHAGKLEKFDENQLIKLVDGRNVILLIDEVHRNFESDKWDYLLKENHNITTVGVGIPYLNDVSPSFQEKYEPHDFFLTDEDLSNDIISYFSSLIGSSNESEVKDTLLYLLSYSGGHCYPFLKIAEYLFSQHSRNCTDLNQVASIVCGSPFFESSNCKKILGRSFHFDSEVMESSDAILSTGIKSYRHEGVLSKLGLWNHQTNWFISDLFVTFLFLNRKTVSKKVESKKLNISDIISFGLSQLSNVHFTQLVDQGAGINRYEDAIGHFFGYKIASITALYVSPQHIIPREIRSRRKHPCVDYYINGDITSLLNLYSIVI
jgi:hypothetical protein